MVWAELLDALLGGYRKRFKECATERVLLVDDVSRYRAALDASEAEVTRLRQLADSYVSRVEHAESDTARFYVELDRAIRVPDISAVLKAYPRTLVDPWIMTPQQWGVVRPELLSDLKYYAWSDEAWRAILVPIQAEVKKKLGFPKSEINDCDNWTLTMCSFVALAFREAGLDKQGAFLKLLNRNHSYCGYMTPDYVVHVYEPLNGETVGALGETTGLYTTELAYFLA